MRLAPPQTPHRDAARCASSALLMRLFIKPTG
jgi:hypothetical protein